jgi:hypothetical protein
MQALGFEAHAENLLPIDYILTMIGIFAAPFRLVNEMRRSAGTAPVLKARFAAVAGLRPRARARLS